MVQGGQRGTRLTYLRGIDFCEHHARLFTGVRQQLSPRIDNQRMAEGPPPARMLAALAAA